MTGLTYAVILMYFSLICLTVPWKHAPSWYVILWTVHFLFSLMAIAVAVSYGG